MKERGEGFTLIELMVAVAVIAIIASIAVPRLLSSRITANEAATYSTLKAIASAQAQCRASGVIDANSNGAGEFAFLGELSGAVGIRIDESGGTGTERIRPAFVSAGLGNVQGGQVLRSGYRFQMFLPGAGCAPLAEAANGGATGVSVQAVFAESSWCCYAWPASRGVVGHRAFFVNHVGEVLACRNTTARYNGTAVMPAGTAAALGTVSLPHMGSSIAANATGQDGEFWGVVN